MSSNKWLILAALYMVSTSIVIAQDPSAIIQFDSQDRGILIPRMGANQWVSITDPADGLMVYDSSQYIFYFFNGNTWQTFSSGPIGPQGVGVTSIAAIDIGGGMFEITFNLSNGSSEQFQRSIIPNGLIQKFQKFQSRFTIKIDEIK